MRLGVINLYRNGMVFLNFLCGMHQCLRAMLEEGLRLFTIFYQPIIAFIPESIGPLRLELSKVQLSPDR